MLVGIYDQRNPNGLPQPRLLAYEKILKHNGIPYVWLDTAQPDFWRRVAEVDLFLLRWAHYDTDRQRAHDLLPVIEKEMGVPCFPDWNTCWHYDDKLKQYLLMKKHGFPMVESYVFWGKKEALEWVERAEYPVVFKLRGGAGSINVFLVKDRGRARKLVRRMFGKGIVPGKFFTLGDVRFQHPSLYREARRMAANLFRFAKGVDVSPFWQVQKNYALFQKYLPGNDSDTRVTVIGGRAFAFRRLVRERDFRASGSGRIDYDLDKIDKRCVQIAHAVSEKMGFQSMAYDFLFTEENEPQFCEISYTYVPKAVYDCAGYWDRDMNWREGHYWPEYLHLADALKMPDLKAPELDY